MSRFFNLLPVLGFAFACGDAVDPVPGTVEALSIVSGNNQVAVVNHELDEPLVVRASDSSGIPVPGVSVTFRVTSGGGETLVDGALSDAAGLVRTRWVLGTTTDSQRLEATIISPETGLLISTAFSADARADSPVALLIVAGQGQHVLPTVTMRPLVVRVVDQHGNGVPQVAVSWTTDSGVVHMDQTTDTTDAAGIATTHCSLHAFGYAEISANVANQLPASFEAYAVLPDGQYSFTKVAGDSQTYTVSEELPESLQVRVSLLDGTGVLGVPVRWHTSDGSLSDSLSITDESGLATIAWTMPSYTELYSGGGYYDTTWEAYAYLHSMSWAWSRVTFYSWTIPASNAVNRAPMRLSLRR